MLIWAIIIIVAVWLIVKYSRRNAPPGAVSSSFNESTNHTLSEEEVFEAQNKFEKNFEHTYLPDAIGGKDIYIYRNLMHKWFHELSAKNRYNEEMIQKLRRDMLDWIYSVEQGKTANYLSFELEDEESRNAYSDEATVHGRKSYTIENAFASAIGEQAIKELERIRTLDYSEIDQNGNLAPEGYRFDLSGELEPIKK